MWLSSSFRRLMILRIAKEVSMMNAMNSVTQLWIMLESSNDAT